MINFYIFHENFCIIRILRLKKNLLKVKIYFSVRKYIFLILNQFYKIYNNK